MRDSAIAALAMMAVQRCAAGFCWAQRKAALFQWKPAEPVTATVTAIQPGETLVVVDMQWFYLKNIPRRPRQRAIANVLEEISAAKAIMAPVVLLSCANSGKPIKVIADALAGYAFCWTATKTDDGGGAEVLATCDAHHSTSTAFRLCGGLTDACVFQTAVQLKPRGTVQVVVDACVTDSVAYDWYEYLDCRAGKDILLVRQKEELAKPVKFLPDTTLVVVDMEVAFLYDQGQAGHRCVTEVGREITAAARHDVPVVNLTYSINRQVDPRIKFWLAQHSRVEQLPKAAINGAPEVRRACLGRELQDFPTKVFRLCGVMGDACVLATAEGLAELYPHSRIEIVTDACLAFVRAYPWREYKSVAGKNIFLVRHNGKEVPIPLSDPSEGGSHG